MREKNYTDRSWVELSRENIKYNLTQIKKCLFDNEEIIYSSFKEIFVIFFNVFVIVKGEYN